MTAPTVKAVGSVNSGTTAAVTYVPPAHQAGDILLFVGETNVTGGLATTTTGWAHTTTSPRAQGSNVTSINLIWKRAESASEPSLVITATSNHQIGVIVNLRGCIASGNPWDFTPVGSGGATTSASITGGTTTVAETLVLWCGTHSADSATNPYTSISGPGGGISGFTTNSQSSTTNGNGGGFVVCSGTLATAGATGAVTATVPVGSWSAICLAFKPAVSAPPRRPIESYRPLLVR